MELIIENSKLDTNKQGIQNDRVDARVENWITQENHRVESLWIALKGWWNNERNQQRLNQIKQILSELNYEKYGFERK